MAVSPKAPPVADHVPKPVRNSRPNYNKLHARPLPLKTYPLPTLIPHNPLSILSIALTYFIQLVFPPSSHSREAIHGYYSDATRSVHITNEASARILWEQGFFGKGSLSRSEPSWLERERIRQGHVAGDASEIVTRRRREERQQFKQERARKEREAIEEKLAEEAQPRPLAKKPEENTSVSDAHLETEALTSRLEGVGNSEEPASSQNQVVSEANTLVDPDGHVQISSLQPVDTAAASSEAIVNQEHLQLTLEEAFFLVYGLGVLEVQHGPNNRNKISTSHLFSICRSCSYFPSRPSSELSPDDPFLLSYAVYHHFRSLGWVVRPGIKFGVDHLLYNRGPVFSHAEFAVIVLPSYNHSYWSSSVALQSEVKRKEKKTWWWLHCVNRVQAQVRKTLVVAFVEVPPPADVDSGAVTDDAEVVDIGRFLKRYRVRELIFKRWTPNRNRG